MRKLKGIHFYINIVNYNDIILDEESMTGKVTHAIHALDTFFTSIERYGKKLSPQTFVVEKITGARLHMYVTDELEPAFDAVKAVSAYAYRLAGLINKSIPKYKLLKDFYINVGAAYGKFYDFEFTSEDGYSEMTTIGYAANFAAKLQALSKQGWFSISDEIYNALADDEKMIYRKEDDDSIQKYGQDRYYSAWLGNLESPAAITDEDMSAAKDYANSDNLGDIEFGDVRGNLNFSRVNRTHCKRLDGIPVFADVRGFTSQFEEDDSNLKEMAQKTREILASMYKVSTKHGGVHVQFQGDRELSLYHNVPGQKVNGAVRPEQKCFKAAVLAAMRMVDEVKPYNVHIGVGEDFGRLFATKIGARGEKDNILIGETVIHADFMEDKKASEDQIAITREVYDGLKAEDGNLAGLFRQKGDYFITTVGHQEYLKNISYGQLGANTLRNKYNGAWGDLL